MIDLLNVLYPLRQHDFFYVIELLFQVNIELQDDFTSLS